MAAITLKGNPCNTVGDLPSVGASAPSFTLVGNDLGEKSLSDFAGKKVILSLMPSFDTPVCATSVRKFNEQAASLPDTAVVNVSMDLPFAQKRFCTSEGIEGVTSLSAFRSSFGQDYGIAIADGPLAGLLGRAIIVLDSDGKVVYTELVPEIAQEPNYDAAIAAVK